MNLDMLFHGIIIIAPFAILLPIIYGIIVLWELHKDEKAKAVTTKPLTPEELYDKCCYCPHYATCTKTLEEVIKC
jgi:hypothetical protein